VPDCGEYSQCIESERLPDIDGDGAANDGFCATYVGDYEISCNLGSGARCPAGQACYSTPDGKTFCAEPLTPPGAQACLTTDTAPCDTNTCVRVAGGALSPPNNGYCFKPCDYDVGTFPSEGADSPTGNCELWETCYQVPAGSEAGADGYCAYPQQVPGAPLVHCDDDHGLTDDQGDPRPPDFMCGRFGMAVCAGLRDAVGNPGSHSPTVEPEGVCVARCLAGADGDWGSCFGDPSACVPDADLAGTCLSFALIDAPCDPLTQTGCAPFETCTTDFFPLPPGGYLSTCTGDVGLADQGEECYQDGADLAHTCMAGLMCQGDTTGTDKCFAACDPLDPVCDGGFTCVDVSRAFFGSGGHVGLCMVDDGCDLVAQNCPDAGDTCLPVGIIGPHSNENHALQCVPAGGAALGDGCSNNESGQGCEEGSTCSAGLFDADTGEPLAYCTSFCDPSTPTNNSACPVNTGGFGADADCADVSAQFNAPTGTYGVCVK
jgi:hypothetical protein